MLSIRIRKAELNDYKSLLPLFNQGDLLHREALPEIFVEPEGNPRERGYFQDLILQPDVGFFIAERQSQIIGFVHVTLMASPPLTIFAPRRYAVVDSVVVKQNDQDMGVGRKLMETVHEWAREKGAESVELNVYEFNQNAISFYEHLGYETLSRKMRKSLSKHDRDRAD